MELAARNLEEDDLGREHLALVPSPSGSIEDTYQFLQRFFEDIDEDSMDGELVIPASPRSDVELVRVKTCLPVALKQNDAFLLWRAVTLTKYYKSRCMGDMHEATAEGALHYLATAGNDSGYRHEGVPGHLYFLRNILPVVSNMARTPEALEKLSIDALGVLKELITSQLSFTTHRTSPALLDSFFEDIEPEDMRSWGRGGGAAAGQFKYFFNYGKQPWEDDPQNQRQRRLATQRRENRKWLTMAIAKFQSWESDRHYDGLDFTNGTREIEERFIPVYKAIPEPLRAKAMRAFVNYGGHYHSAAFLNCAYRVVKHFRENGGAQYLRHFFDIAQGAPDLHLDSMSDKVSSQSFPIAEPEAAFKECEAIAAVPEFRKELVELARYMVEGYYHRGGYVPTFIVRSKDENDDDDFLWRGSSRICMPKIIEKFKALKYPKRKIREILNIPAAHPFLPKEVAVPLVSCYPEIDANFPGGVKALLVYLEGIKDSHDCMFFLVNSLKGDQDYDDGGKVKCNLPKNNLIRYLEFAKMVVARLGDVGAQYFETGFLRKGSKFMRLAESNFDEFERLVHEAIEFVEAVPDLPDLEKDRKHFFDAYVDDFAKPNFDKYLSFLRIIRDGIISYVAEKGGKLPPRDEFRFSHIHEAIDLIKHNLHLISPSSPKDADRMENYKNPFPADVDYEALGKFVAYMIFSERDYYQEGVRDYLKLISGGVDYRVAAFVRFDQSKAVRIFDGEKNKILKSPALRVVPGMESPIPFDKLTEIVSLVADINTAIKEVCNICVSKDPEKEHIDPDEERTKRLGPAAFKESSSALSRLHALRMRLEAFENDSELGSYIDFSHLKRQIEASVTQAAFKRMLSISLDGPNQLINLKPRGLLKTTNPSTRMILTCTALLASLGIIRVPDEVRNQLRPIALLPSGLGSHLMQTQTFDDLIRKHRDDLVRNMEAILPHFERLVLASRLDIPEMFPVGGKVHTKYPMDDSGIKYLAEAFGISSSTFVLQHANKSLCLPPQLSSFEMKLFVRILEILGFIDSDTPDLQLTMCGRLQEHLARRVGTAMLLGTDRGVIYEHGAFRSKSHDTQTGAHIMAYDAGVLHTDLPTHPGAIEAGRTDMFGRHSFSDVDLYQIVGTLGTSLEYKTGFEDIARKFFEILMKILEKHDLVKTMNRTNWLYDSQIPGGLAVHEEMVNALGNIWMRNSKAPNYGVIGEINQLVEWALDEMRAISAQRENENRDLIQRVKIF